MRQEKAPQTAVRTALALLAFIVCTGLAARAAPRSKAADMEPRLFDITLHGKPPEGTPAVQPWKRIELDPDYAGAWVVAGDLNGDGRAEIVSARNVNTSDPPGFNHDGHYTCSVIACDLDGEVLWRWGDPAEGRNKLHHDVGCQIHDWDVDGENEVVLATRDRLVTLDGLTGKPEDGFPIPTYASDCIAFAELDGSPPDEVLVKSRYSHIWAFNRQGEELWKVERPAGHMTAHQPVPMDLDGDGRQAVLAGYAMLNPDGSVRWDLNGLDIPLGGHLDCGRLFERGPTPAQCSILMTFCGGNRIAMVSGDGRELLWSIEGYHFESIDTGEVLPDVPGREIAVDIAHRPSGDSPLWLLSARGELLGNMTTQGSRHHVLLDREGNGRKEIIMATARTAFDGRGVPRVAFDIPREKDDPRRLCARGDMDGDGREDLLFWGNPASAVTIFRREGGQPDEDAPLGTGPNVTLY